MKELPARLRGTAAAQGVRVIASVVVALLLLVPLFTGSKTNGILVTVVVFSIVAVSLTVLMGYAGQVSLGHWGLVGVGAFSLASMVTRIGMPYLLALPLTVVVGMAVSLVIGLPALRIRGLYLAVATLAFNLAAEFFIFRSRLVGGSAGVSLRQPGIGPLHLSTPTYRPLFYFAVVMLGLSMVVARNLARSRTGRGFFALRENEKAAATLGVGLTRYKLLAFAVSGGIAALAGAVNVTYFGLAQSEQYPTALSLALVSLVMIGGLGSLSGSVFGAFLVFGLPNLVHFSNGWIVPIGTGALLLIVIVRARGGVAGVVQALRERLVRGLDELATPPPAATAPTGGGGGA
jgi:branched-chain amino acid transport system permease protein